MNYYDTEDQLVTAIETNPSLVVCCYSDWCPACSQTKPSFEHVARLYQDRCTFGKVRTDESPELASSLQIAVIPTILFFSQRTLRGRVVGAIDQARLKAAVESLLTL